MAQRAPIDPDSPAVDGTPVWKLPGLGGQKRAAAFLWFNKAVGDRFTMAEIREAIGTGGEPEKAEHLNRRLRELRPQGWDLPSNKEDSTLAVDEYEVKAKGHRVWAGESLKLPQVSLKLRRIVLDRDGHRCVLCGVGSGEPYPESPGSVARMTVGHLHAQARVGAARKENLRTECARCNEPMRDELRDADTVEEVLAASRGMGRDNRATLRRWIEQGYMTRSPLQELFDRVRVLAKEDQQVIAESLR